MAFADFDLQTAQERFALTLVESADLFPVRVDIANSRSANGQVYFRSSHAFKSLPPATQAHNGGGRTIRLGTGGLYAYLFATYSGYGSEVWYVGNLTGIVTIPFLAGRHCLTGWTLFGTSSAGVPDGGVTVMLLGVALGVLALARRFLMR